MKAESLIIFKSNITAGSDYVLWNERIGEYE